MTISVPSNVFDVKLLTPTYTLDLGASTEIGLKTLKVDRSMSLSQHLASGKPFANPPHVRGLEC